MTDSCTSKKVGKDAGQMFADQGDTHCGQLIRYVFVARRISAEFNIISLHKYKVPYTHSPDLVAVNV